MPEFPEVKTFIDNLKQQGLLNQTIKQINFFDQKILKNTSVNIFKKKLIGNKIIDINQIGKLIIIQLNKDVYLTIHLRMEGKLFYIDSNLTNPKYCMVEIICGQKKLIYLDFRKFGTFNLYLSKKDLLNSSEIMKLGLQPFDKQLTATYLYNKIHPLHSAIKTILLDQSIIAGIGNIYADEILFACHIHPLTKAHKLKLLQCKNIIKYCQKIMQLAIKNHGTTISSYAFAPHHAGNFQKYLKVHSQENKTCFICHEKIKKIKINGRGTYFCPNCQKILD